MPISGALERAKPGSPNIWMSNPIALPPARANRRVGQPGPHHMNLSCSPWLASCHRSPAKSHRCRNGRKMCAEKGLETCPAGREANALVIRSGSRSLWRRVGSPRGRQPPATNIPRRHTNVSGDTGSPSDREGSPDVFSVMRTAGEQGMGPRSAPPARRWVSVFGVNGAPRFGPRHLRYVQVVPRSPYRVEEIQSTGGGGSTPSALRRGRRPREPRMHVIAPKRTWA